MRLLIDTHVLLWWLADDKALTPSARDAITIGTSDVFVSAISFAEIAIKKSLGKLAVPDGVTGASHSAGFEDLDFKAAHATELEQLPWHHRDPFDRMLIAQAKVERLTIVTSDARFADYHVDLLAS